jgi:hypothetical protein
LRPGLTWLDQGPGDSGKQEVSQEAKLLLIQAAQRCKPK